MDCEKIIELGLLSEEDAWIMFKSYARIGNSTSKKLIDKGRKIAKECKQLPVAISVIASTLKGQQHREHEWDVTLKSLKKRAVSMHGVEEDKVGIYKCLKFSYDYLKDEKAKGLFLLCSVFQEDKEYSIEVLTRHCIGVGLLGEDYGSYDDARNQIVVAKNKLLDSCLLLEDSEKRLRMHDLVRDAAQWIAKEEIQCVKLFDEKQKSLVENQKNIKYLLCEGKCMDFFNLKFDHGSKLEILIVSVDGDEDRQHIEVPNSFFENVINLRVLYFSGKDHRPLSLPPSIKFLTNIRSMSVDHVDLGDISILGNLQSLETLDLDRCIIKELPDQITKLRKFKLLRLEVCQIRMNNPFEVIKRCSSLEELFFKYSFNDFCKEITLPKLQRYHINMNHWKPFYSGRTNLSKYVVFRGNEARQFSEETLKYCMQTAESLCLDGIKGEWRNLMPEILPLEHGMNDLVELHLGEISQLQCLIDTIGSQEAIVLSKLVVLELEEMENLEELFNGPLSFESMNNLEKLSINDCQHLQSLFKGKLNLCNLNSITIQSCPMLVSLFEVSTSQSLVLLETLKIVSCEGLETIIAEERREAEEIEDSGNSKVHGSVFSKLKVIDIKECPLLESILPFLSTQGLPVLETIRIIKCDGLKYVFGQSQHVELVSLTKLELSELPNFIGIFEECYHPMSSCVKGSSSTSKAEIQLDPIKCNTFSWWTHICCQTTIPLVDVDVDGDQPHDCSVVLESNSYGLNIWEHLRIPSKILCNIKKIVLTHFLKMKSVFILSIDLIMQLETLIIKNCDELKHVIIDTGDHNISGNICVNVFPKLKVLYVEDCAQLEYIFGQDTIDILELTENVDHFLTLEFLDLLNCNVENWDGDIKLTDLPMMTCLFVGPKYSFALKNLTVIRVVRCDKLKFVISTSMLRFLPQLQVLRIEECNELEHIIEDDDLENKNNSNSLSSTTCFPKLQELSVIKCNKLKFVFSTSILRFLPQLRSFKIEECKELKHIIEDDLENKKNSNSLSSTTCFPKLQELSVIKCNKLKFVFPFFVCKELPELNVLVIQEANELEEIFKSEDDHKVDISNLNFLVFDMLSSLSDAQGNQFQNVKNRIVRNCDKKLPLTSASTTNTLREITNLCYTRESELYRYVRKLFELQSAETTEDFEKPSVENVQDLTILPTNSKLEGSTSEITAVATVSTIFGTKNDLKQKAIEIEGTSKSNNDHGKDFLDRSQKVEDLAILPTNSEIQMKQTPETEHELAILPTNSEELLNEQSLGETHTLVKPSQLEGSTSQITTVATVSTISGTKNEPPIQVVAPKQKGIEKEGVSKTNNDHVSLTGNAFMKVNSTIEEQFPKDDEIIVSKSKPYPSITSPIASQFPSVSSKGDPSQKVEDLSSFLVKRELEELVSKNHLDDENLSLLTDFLVRNPSVHLMDTSLPNRYKGCAYNLLAELLKFLETHSLLEVSGSCHSEFVELLQDARYFAFDKEWLDGVERRALFPETQVSPDALEKLLDSKKRVTKDVEDLRFKIQILSQHVEDLKHQLISSEAVLESIIEQEAVLSAPIGY